MRSKIIWACSECGSRNYTTDNKEKPFQRLTLKKYCKACNAHTVHLQTK
ncbi:50S ribosomal protein L33 [Siminovitchia sediminis]|uniref:Large ribosomal subunit protein bL33 n=1 Tax=Siminovitchia sediminis TaxID=1274353 RepID=A0ABW4KNP7_9BACI